MMLGEHQTNPCRARLLRIFATRLPEDGGIRLRGWMRDPGEVFGAVHLAKQFLVFDRPLVHRRDEKGEAGVQQMSVLTEICQSETIDR